MATRLPPNKEGAFPLLLVEGYDVKSIETWDYNCIAFAADNDSRWWWPDPYGIGFWPDNIPREITLDAFLKAYQTLGYKRCPTGDFEEGYDKVAIYEANGKPSHAAKQTADGKWKSKLGRWEDIEHSTPRAVETLGGVGGYGVVSFFMRRRISG